MATRLVVMMIPPPMPWTARNAISWVIVWLRPVGTEPIMKMVMPRRKKILRPYRSESPAHDRYRDRGRHQVGGRSPRVAVESSQVDDDAGHRGGDDSLTQRGQEHRQHDSGQRQQKLSSGKGNEVAIYRLIGSGFGLGADVHVDLLPQRSFRRKQQVCNCRGEVTSHNIDETVKTHVKYCADYAPLRAKKERRNRMSSPGHPHAITIEQNPNRVKVAFTEPSLPIQPRPWF